MKKRIIGCGRICISLIKFFGVNFWFKQVKKADNHGNPETRGNIDLLGSVWGELKKLCRGDWYIFTYIFIYSLILLLLGILVQKKEKRFWNVESSEKSKHIWCVSNNFFFLHSEFSNNFKLITLK